LPVSTKFHYKKLIVSMCGNQPLLVSDRSGHTATGMVCNLAARPCAEAKDGQILVSSRIAEAVGAIARLEDLGNLELKGLRRPVADSTSRRAHHARCPFQVDRRRDGAGGVTYKPRTSKAA
jgi:hypothetical protein